MEKILNLVFFKDIRKFLYDENFHLMVIQKNEEFYIHELNHNFNGYNSILRDYLCYNFDKLKDYNKVYVKNSVISFKQLNNKIYVLKK